MRRLLAATVLLALTALACGSGSGPTVALDEDIELSLARACVAHGEEQVLRVRAPRPTVVAFGTTYADGEGGGPPPFGAGYGGNDSAVVPDSGEVEMSWTASESAPPGPVVVEVRVVHDDEQQTGELEFTLVGPDEPCP